MRKESPSVKLDPSVGKGCKNIIISSIFLHFGISLRILVNNFHCVLTDPFIILGTQTTVLELIAVGCGLSSVWFMKKESILVYPFGIVNVLIYIYICFTSRLYAYAAINVFYAVMSAYGWYNWLRKNQEDERIRISRLRQRGILLYLVSILFFFLLFWFILRKFTDSEIPSWDALTTSIYVIAMWLLARKKIEHWVLWIAGDIISIGMFAWLDLYFSSFQFLVFTLIAVLGFMEWKRKIAERGT